MKVTAGPTLPPTLSPLKNAERQLIVNALKNAGGKISGKGGAAERLGLKRTTLYYKMHKLKIVPSLSKVDSVHNNIDNAHYDVDSVH